MTFAEFKTIIEKSFPEVTALQMEQFEKMDALYRDWNSKINVVSRKDIDELYRHHVLHSLGIAAYIKTHMPDVYEHLRGEGPYSIAEPMKIMDLGTGGGFPGIPLAVMFPNAQFTLCDSIGKKIIVATEVAKGLGLANVKTVNARAESLPDIFNYIEEGFISFLNERINEPKSEYYLPSVVSSLIEKGIKSVNVLVAEDKWYGVTYKEDKEIVVSAMQKLMDDGVYEGL